MVNNKTKNPIWASEKFCAFFNWFICLFEGANDATTVTFDVAGTIDTARNTSPTSTWSRFFLQAASPAQMRTRSPSTEKEHSTPRSPSSIVMPNCFHFIADNGTHFDDKLPYLDLLCIFTPR